MPGIGVVLNPYSRSNRNNPGRADRLGFIVGDKGSCHTTSSLEDIALLAREFKEREIEVLAISGGDGTYHHTLTIFSKVYGEALLPKIAFLRGGTMNIVADDLNIRGTPESLLSELIYRYHQEGELKTVPLPMLKIGDRCGFVFGVGFIHRFIEEYYHSANYHPTKGHAAKLAFLVSMHCLFNSRKAAEMGRRFDAQVFLDGTPWPFKNYVSILGGTVQTGGLCFRPFYQARADLQRSHVIGLSVPPRSIIWHLPYFMLGKKVPSEHFLEGLARRVEIKFKEPQPYTLDGEFLEPVSELLLDRGPILQVIV